MTNVTAEVAAFVTNLSYDDLPAEVVARTGMLLTDIVGITLRARHEAPLTQSLLLAAQQLGLSDGETSVIGDTAGYSPAGAALLNGALAHSLDFDDTHTRATIHCSAPVVPAALAAGEMVAAEGADVIAGIVAGYEVQIRLGLALRPKLHRLRGFHVTATCGAFGAAAAASRIFGLTAVEAENAFGAALSQAAGSVQFASNGAWTKAFQVGNAAMSGLVAASLAREGFLGAADSIGGKAGFLNAYSPDPDHSAVSAGLGETWETLAIAVKPYPCCRFSHAALDALISLRLENDLRAEEITAVEIGLPEAGWNAVGDPENRRQNPQSIVDGQFSMPFLAAVVLRQGSLQWDDYPQHLEDHDTLAFCRRISCVVDARAEAEYPRQMSGVARVHTDRGNFEQFVKVPKGEPEDFPSEAMLRAKFSGLVGPYLSSDKINVVSDSLLSFGQANDISAVLRGLTVQ
jgi:2-methylcitrate dehydratase PrpD